jgi:hypothetical protein
MSLRQAIQLANQFGSATITFDPTVFATPQGITLNGTPLELSGPSITIIAPTALLTLGPYFRSGVFIVDPGATANISGFNIGASKGSAIINQGNLTLSNTWLSDNGLSGLAANYGGATQAAVDPPRRGGYPPASVLK